MPVDFTDVKKWLDQFGYTKTDLPADQQPTINKAITDMQEAYGIKTTGEIDGKTLKAMVIPRCGNPDVFPLREHLGGAASTLYKWELGESRMLSYFLDKNSLSGLDLPFAEVQAIIRDAFNFWEACCNIHFQQIDNINQSNLRFACGTGRQAGFDGPGNILAWAELPVGGNQPLNLKYDGDEPFYGKLRQRGIALLNTSSHEIGHLLGLTHSRAPGALMAPTYSEAIPGPVQNDDIQRAVWRYGEFVAMPTPPPPVTPSLKLEKIKLKYVGDQNWYEHNIA